MVRGRKKRTMFFNNNRNPPYFRGKNYLIKLIPQHMDNAVMLQMFESITSSYSPKKILTFSVSTLIVNTDVYFHPCFTFGDNIPSNKMVAYFSNH